MENMENIKEAGVENVAAKSDRDDLHKRKNLKMSCGVYDNRLLRAIKKDDRRRSARYDRLWMKRQIPEGENLVLDDENKESLIKTDEQVNPDNGNIQMTKENIFVVPAEIKVESVLNPNVASNILDKDSIEDPKNVTCVTDGTLTSEELVETVTDNTNDEDSIKESKQKELEENTPNDCSSNINNSKIPVRVSTVITSSYSTEDNNKKYTKCNSSQGLTARRALDDSKDVDNDTKLPNKAVKPPREAPTNDRREKLQQYLAEKKKLNQVKRRIEKPAFRPTGKIKYDVGPVGAIKPNSYSVGTNNRQNHNAISNNGSFGSRQGPFGSRSGTCISRSGSSLVRTASNLSRKNSVVSRGGSTGAKSGSPSSKNGSTFSKTNSNLARTHSSLSRSTLTMIR